MSNGKLGVSREQLMSAQSPGVAKEPRSVAGDLGFEPLVPEDKGLLRGMNQQEVRARNQPNSRAVLNSILQIGSTGIGDAVAGLGYLGELKDINDIVSGNEGEWGNWLVELGESIKQAGADAAPVYASEQALTTFDPWDGEWWASNIPSIGSTLGIALPAVGSISLLSRFGKAVGIAGKMSKATGKFATGLSSALVSRHVENMMEAKEVFDNSYRLALSKGKNKEEAKKVAGDAAANSYNTNYVNLLTDVPQYLALLGVKIPKGPKSVGGNLVAGFGSEAFEEATQFVIQQESERGAKIALGEKDDRSAFQRLGDYLGDPGLQTAAFFGGLGGTVFSGIGQLGERLSKDKEQEDVREETLEAIVGDAVENDTLEQATATVEALSTEESLTEDQRAKAEQTKQTIAHAQKTANSLKKDDPLKTEKVVAQAKAKDQELSLQRNEQSVEATRASMKNPESFDLEFAKRVKKYGSPEVKKEMDKQIKAIESQYTAEKPMPKDINNYSAYSTLMDTLAAERAKLMEQQAKTSEQIKDLDSAKAVEKKKKQELAKKKKERTKAFEDAKATNDPKALDAVAQKHPELKEDVEKVKQEKRKEEQKRSTSRWKDYDANTVDDFLKARYDGNPFLLEHDLKRKGYDSIDQIKSDLLQAYEEIERKEQTQKQEEVQGDTQQTTSGQVVQTNASSSVQPQGEDSGKSLVEELEAETIAEEANESVDEAQEIIDTDSNDQMPDAVQVPIEDDIENPFIGQTNDAAFYKVTKGPKGSFVVFSGIGKYGNVYRYEDVKDKYDINPKASKWTTLYDIDGLLVESQWRQPEFDYEKLSHAGDLGIMGAEVTFEVDTTQGVEAFDSSWESIRILVRAKGQTLAMVKAWNNKTKNSPGAEQLEALRRAVYEGWKDSQKSTVEGFIDQVDFERNAGLIADIMKQLYPEFSWSDLTDIQIARDVADRSAGGIRIQSDNTVTVTFRDNTKSGKVTSSGLSDLIPNRPSGRYIHPVKGKVVDIYAGRFLRAARNNPIDVLAKDEPLVFAVGVTEGSVTQFQTGKGITIPVMSNPASTPTPGAVYQAVKTANGRYAWSRVFTKKLRDQSAVAVEGMLPIWEEQYGFRPDIPLSQVVKELLSLSISNPDLWKDQWSDIRKEINSIVRFYEINAKGKRKIAPDFGPNLGKILTSGRFKDSSDPVQDYYDFLDLDNKTIQIDNRLINDGDYNANVSNRLSTNLNPGTHTHSPSFVFEFPQSDAAPSEHVAETNSKQFVDPDEDVVFRYADSDRYELWNEEQEVAWFKKRFPNVPIHVYRSLKDSEGRDVWGALHSAAGVLLSSKAADGTTYHEAFHVAFNLGLTERQKAQALDQIRDQYPNKSDQQLEEILSDKFMEYVQGLDTSLSARLKRYFRRLLDLINYVVNNRLSIDYLFDRIERGKYSKVTLGPKFNPKFRLVEPFTNLKEQRQRVKESFHFFDLIAGKYVRKHDVTLTEAYKKIISDKFFDGDGETDVPSIKNYFESAREKLEKPTKLQNEQYDRVLEALKTEKFKREITNKLSSRGINIKETVDDVIFENEQNYLEAWQKKAMQISPMDNMTARLKRLLSNVPEFTHTGKRKMSRIGIAQMHDGRFLYADLQTKLGGSTSVNDMLNRLEAIKLHHYKWLYAAVKGNKQLQGELFTVAQKVHPVFFDVVNHKGKYSVKVSNTDSIANVLLAEWFTGFSNHLTNAHLNPEGNIVYSDRLASRWQGVYSKLASGTNDLQGFVNIASALGIELDIQALQAAAESEQLTNIAMKFDAFVKAFIGGDLTFDNKPIKSFARTIGPFYSTKHQSAHINIEGNREYEWINSSYIGRMMNQLKAGTFDWNKLRKDPMFNKLLNDEVINTSAWEKGLWGVVGGIKHREADAIKGIKSIATPFVNYSDAESYITLLTMFKGGWYNVSVNSSSSPVLSAVNLGKEKSIGSAIAKINRLADAEYARMNRANVEGWKNYNPNHYIFFPYMQGGQSPNYAQIKFEMEKGVEELKANLTELGVITNTGHLSFDKSLNTDEFLKEFYYNYTLNQAQIVMMMQGDPAFYKGKEANKVDDFFKRAREVWSPGNYLDTSAEFNTGEKIVKFPTDGKYRLKILKDVETKAPQFAEIREALLKAAGQSDADAISDKYAKGVNETDAQSYIDIYSYRLRMIGLSKWTEDMQVAYDLIVEGQRGSEIFQPIKPFYYTQQLNDTLLYPMQNKDSEFLLTPAMADGNPKLEKILFDMGYSKDSGVWSFDEAGRDSGKYIDKVSFESAVKVQMTSPIVGEELEDARIVDMYWDDWRRQLETPEHHLDAKSSFGTQIMKLIVADIADAAKFGDRTGADVKEEYEQLVIQDIIRSSEQLMGEFTKDGKVNKEKFVQLVKAEVNKRQLGDQYIDALEMTYNDVLKEMDTALPLFHPLHASRVEALISSLFKNRVTKQKFQQGVSLYNVSSYGLSKKPKIIFKDDGSIDHIQAYAPVYTKYLEKYRQVDGSIDYDAVKANEPELLEGLVYRIPTEDKYSMFNIKIIGFLPDEVGGGVVLPPEITTIAGLDFDIDKTFGFFYSKGNPHSKALARLDEIIERDFERNILESTDEAVDALWQGIFQDAFSKEDYSEEEIADVLEKSGKSYQGYKALQARAEAYDAKQKSDNAKLMLMKEILQHPTMTKAFLNPGGFDTIRNLAKRIDSVKNQGGTIPSIISPITAVDTFRRIAAGAALTGIAANYNAARARWQRGAISTSFSVLFDGHNYQSLSSIQEVNKADKNPKPVNVSKNIAEVLASAVDNGKEPLAEMYNMNNYTADVGMSLLALGVPLKTMMLFLSQPGIVAHTQNYMNTGQDARSSLKKPFDVRTNELFNSLTDSADSEIQARYLDLFLYYKSKVTSIGDLVNATKVGDAGAGPSIAHTFMRVKRYGKLMEDLPGSYEFLQQESLHKELYDKGITNAMDVFNQLGFPSLGFNSGLGYVLGRLGIMKQVGDLNANEINHIVKHFMEFIATGHGFFKFKDAVKLHEELHEKLAVAKSKLNNVFLDRLEVKDKVINFRAVTSIHKEEFDDFRQSWSELLTDQTELMDGYTASDLAVDLIKYSFYRSGFTTSGFGNFAHLQPIEFYTKHSEGRKFNDVLIQQVQAQNKTSNAHFYNKFVEQYIRNNYTSSSLVRNVRKEDIPDLLMERTVPEYIKVEGKLMKFDGIQYNELERLGLYDGDIQLMREYDFNTENLQSAFNLSTNPADFEMYSGKAKGADTSWDRVSREYGVGKIRHYLTTDYDSATEGQKKEADRRYRMAAKVLGRPVIPDTEYVGKLMRRNVFQVKSSDAIFAISTIKDNKVDGGTGYAVHDAINQGKPVFVFDQNKEQWFTYDGEKFVPTDVPVLTPKFAGVGTRKINAAGEKAIEDVFQKTFKQEVQAREDQIAKNKEIASLEKPIVEDTVEEQQEPEFKLNEEQQVALDTMEVFIQEGNPAEFFVLEGKAGTGKTTVLAQLLKEVNPFESKAIAALAHKAKSVLLGKLNEAGVRAQGYSIAGLLGMNMDEETGKFTRKNSTKQPPVALLDIIVIDEASMVNEQALELIMRLKKPSAKVIFAGDIGQLPPIRESKSTADSPVFNSVNKASLRTRVRQGEESSILPYADYYWDNSREDASAKDPVQERKSTESLSLVDSMAKVYKEIIAKFKAGISENNVNKIKVVVYRNKNRIELNEVIRRSIHGDIKEPYVKGDLIMLYAGYTTPDGIKLDNSQEFQIQDKPFITTETIDGKDYQYYVIPVLANKEENLIVTTDIHVLEPGSRVAYARYVSRLFEEAKKLPYSSRERSRAMAQAYEAKEKFANVDYAYAITSHKSQGSTYETVVVDENDIMGVSMTSNKTKSQSMYTAITRASDKAIIISAKNPSVQEETGSINVWAGTGQNTILSNMGNKPFTFTVPDKYSQGLFKDKLEVPTVEHAFQYMKLYFTPQDQKNKNVAAKILKAATPFEAKTLGRKFTGLDSTAWDKQSEEVMKMLMIESFKQNPNALKALMNTGSAELTHKGGRVDRWTEAFPRILTDVRSELRGDSTQTQESTEISSYTGNITPDKGTVFMFGSNPEGRHGAGAAKIAKDQFGAKQGQGEGEQGNAYALPTKDLGRSKELGLYSKSQIDSFMKSKVVPYYKSNSFGDVINDPFERSIPASKIIESIMNFYKTARENPSKRYKVAYREQPFGWSLNGYLHGELQTMFTEAGPIPNNVEFSQEWVESGNLKPNAGIELLWNRFSSNILAKNPAMTLEGFKKLVDERGYNKIASYLKKCYGN